MIGKAVFTESFDASAQISIICMKSYYFCGIDCVERLNSINTGIKDI